MIDRLGLPGFFLLHRDMLELARDVAVEVRGPDTARALLPPGRGRGSSVSSIVCYLTGLSHIDPVANDLFLGRFLNEELTALPDIDLDFPRDIREVLIPRIHDRYGRERSALVAAFPTFRSRGAIRELGKVLGLPAGELERVARGAEPWAVRGVTADVETALGLEPGGPPAPLVDPDSRAPFAMSTAEWQAMVNGQRPDHAEARPGDEGRRAALPGRWAWLARLCDEAYGLPRHLSQHSGGMIVSTRPLIDCCPVLPAAMEGRQLCQWDKDSCADAGFLKIDLLGLGMLSCVERAVELIAQTRGERVDLSRIPFDDKSTYAAIQSADTMGVFQIESRAQMQSLHRTRPESLDDLTIQVAIVRPGPILGGAVNPYISRRQKLREDPDFEVPYDHPSLEPVLRDTLGTIIFQDQVIEVAMAFAGFSPGEAEGLRRAMSRKRSAAAIEAYHQRFIDGAARTHGVDAETAERVYTMIEGFSGFGFPKAHGAAFGLLAYQSTWLRVHYGPEFLCALLNEQPMGFYAPDTLAHEAQRKGIELIAPDVNLSGEECAVDAEGRIRLGLNYVLGARSAEVAALIAARDAGGPFRSLSRPLLARGRRPRGPRPPRLGGRVRRAGRRGRCRGGAEPRRRRGRIGRAGVPHLRPAVRVTAATPQARRTALWRLGVAAPGTPVKEGTQLSLPLGLPGAPPLSPLEKWDAMVADYATTGLTLGPHPAALLRPNLPAGAVIDARPRDARARDPGHAGRAGGRAAAAGHRQGDRLPAARGRVRHDQPDRAAAGLRAPPADRALRAAAARARAAGEAGHRGRRPERLRALRRAALGAGHRGRRPGRAARPRGAAGRAAAGGAAGARRRRRCRRRRAARRRRAGRLPRRRAGGPELCGGPPALIAAPPRLRRHRATQPRPRLRAAGRYHAARKGKVRADGCPRVRRLLGGLGLGAALPRVPRRPQGRAGAAAGDDAARQPRLHPRVLRRAARARRRHPGRGVPRRQGPQLVPRGQREQPLGDPAAGAGGVRRVAVARATRSRRPTPPASSGRTSTS